MPEIYDFRTQLTKGHLGEANIDKALINMGFKIKKVSVEEEKQTGIDRLMFATNSKYLCAVNNVITTVEIKTDEKAHFTGNFFIETHSSIKPPRRGWIYKSIAQLVIFYVPHERTAWVCNMFEVKHKIEVWNHKYESVPCYNNTHTSQGLKVPRIEIEDLSLGTIEDLPKWEFDNAILKPSIKTT